MTAAIAAVSVLAPFAAVKNLQHHESFPVVAILKYIGCIENLQHDLSVFPATLNGAAEQRMIGQDLRFVDNLPGDDLGKPRILFLKAANRLRSASASRDHSRFIFSAMDERQLSPRFEASARLPRWPRSLDRLR